MVLAVLVGSGWCISAALFLLCAGIYLHTTLRGEFVAWERLLDRAAVAEDARVLDVGWGRGAVTVAVARRVPRGRVVGVDLGDTARHDERIRARRPSATVTRTGLGPIMWWSGPWVGTSVIVAGPSEG